MGSGQSLPTSSNIRLECFLDEQQQNEVVSGVIRLKVRKNVRYLDEKYEGVVLTLSGQEILVDLNSDRSKKNLQDSTGSSTRSWNTSSNRSQKQSLRRTLKSDGPTTRRVQKEQMIMDFGYTQVGDGIDFRFPFELRLPEVTRAERDLSDGEDDDDSSAILPPSMIVAKKASSSSIDSLRDEGATKQMVYEVRASLRRKGHGRRPAPVIRSTPAIIYAQ